MDSGDKTAFKKLKDEFDVRSLDATHQNRLDVNVSSNLSPAELDTELDSRSLDATHQNRLDVNVSSNLSPAELDTELDSRKLDSLHLNRLDANVSDVGGVLSETAFLAKQEFESTHNLRDNTGTKVNGAIGTLATLTANTGKDMYLIAAWVTIKQDTKSSDPEQFEAVLKIDGIIEDRLYLSTMSTFRPSGEGGGSSSKQGKFILKGVKVTTGKVIKIQVITSDTVLDAAGTLSCFEVPSGTDPTE